MPTFEYTVDGEPQTTPEHSLTATQILQNASIDPATHYLIAFKGQSEQQESYQGRPDEAIHIHQHQRFVSVFSGPTPVS